MTLIHILDSQTDQILDDIPHKYVPFNVHRQSLKDYQETFEFEALAGKSFSQHLAKRNRIIIPGEFGELREFIIFEAVENRMTRNIEVYSWASYHEDLKKAKVIKAHKTDPETAQQHVNIALAGTGWTPGNITYAGIRTIDFENNTNPFGYLKRVAREFELELDFRVEIENGKITRYVDLVERLGEYRGREVVLGKDLLSLTRKENTADIVTALWVYGPEREDGTRLEVFVEDLDALARWGRNGQHLVGEYEPQSTDENMTIERLTQLGRAELDKRINAIVEYEGGIADLENVPGMEHEQIRFADTIRIKDESYSPALYLEARIHTQERDIFVKSDKKVELGDYVEFTEDEVKELVKQLQAQIRQKISEAQLVEYTYSKADIDEKDIPGNQAKLKLDIEVGEEVIETVTGATQKMTTVEQSVKDYVDGKVTDIEIEIDAIEGIVSTKIDDGQARSIFRQEADSFTFEADQINFDGHVFGTNATFNGHLEGATGTFSGSISANELEVMGGDNSSLKLRIDSNDSVIMTTSYSGEDSEFAIGRQIPDGSIIHFGSLQLMAKRVETLGHISSNDGISTYGDISIRNQESPSRLRFEVPGRINDSQIYWNATTSADFGLYYRVNGNYVGRMTSNGDWESQRNIISGNNLLLSAGQSMNIGADSFVRITDKNGWANTNTVYKPLYAAEFNPVSLAKYKRDIEPWKGKGLDVVNQAVVHQYYMYNDTEHLKYGFIIGEEYSTPVELISSTGEAIDLYKSVAIAYKAIQELFDEFQVLKTENELLKIRVEELEKGRTV